MKSSSVAGFFADEIFPTFPFRKNNWKAIAFDRDNYDNTRIPEFFFNYLNDELSSSDNEMVLIKGFGGKFDGAIDGVIRAPFRWDDYKSFMLLRENYSVEYQMVGASGLWACWADAELTVVGGDADRMNSIFLRFGGEEEVLKFMQKDFFLGSVAEHAEMHAYLRGLIHGSS